MAKYDRLTSLDASFLHLERLEYPMHVGAMSILEGESFLDADGQFRIQEVRDLVLSRLDLMPRFRRRLMPVPYDQGRPIWVDDTRFDISYHVRLTALPRPGSWEQLVALTTRVQEQLLDRDRPLWELWFVEGLEDGHVGIIQKTHHALIDGVSGVDVATLLLDITPEYTRPEITEWIPQPPPNPTQLLVDTLLERLTEPAEIVRSFRSMLRGPRLALRRMSQLTRSMSTMVTRDAIAPRTSLNARTGRHRRMSVVRVPLAEIKEIRAGLGGTINDVVLAGVGGGARRLFQHRGEATEDVQLRVMCPVSVRSEDQQGALGNKVSAMFVNVPVDPRSARERLDTIASQTRDLKERQQAVGAEAIMSVTEYVAPTLMSLAARAVHRQPFFNLIVTNVPGPQFPLYMMGGRLLEAFPIVPLTRNLTVVVGILSYDGTLHFGLWADRDLFADLEVFAGGIDDAFAELLKQAREKGQS
ncbi:MAG TPA: wax ester/triacylglycerol synthase family O-acyltransferase [Acidimicrobiia bacterium]|jgi:WS/DGAT/MGAT family acyltransferase|nr:wax ester/triacylglycerol synthase family O-acyltransferase [Acidimicrobiia bacterium]